MGQFHWQVLPILVAARHDQHVPVLQPLVWAGV